MVWGMEVVEFIKARGHPRITAGHPTTLMVTKDEAVGPRGDCIVAVGASKGAMDLSEELKLAIRSGKLVCVTIEVDGEAVKIIARGHPLLSLTHPREFVIRKSKFVCGRTLAIESNKAAMDLPRKFVTKLKNPLAKIMISIEVC